MLFEKHKLVFDVTINIHSGAKWALTTDLHFVCNINKPVCSQNRFFWCFDAGLEHMATRSNGTNFGWLKKPCDISTCDLSPDGNPEKYGKVRKAYEISYSRIATTLSLRVSFPGCSNTSVINGIFHFIRITDRVGWKIIK